MSINRVQLLGVHAAALGRCLLSYQNPIATEILEAQIRLAVQEATDLSFVRKELRRLANAAGI